ncbi:MAG: hypothetical protein HRT98_00040 [Mycoplasmatales bacterium]|nr:hypothetical protein [Mycoplasmatales bacterium]
MKKAKKYMLSIGAITAIAVPATIAMASTSVDTQKNLSFNNIKGNSLQTFGNLSTYQATAKSKLITPTLKEVKFNNNKVDTKNAFIKEIQLDSGEKKTYLGNKAGLWEIDKNGNMKQIINGYDLSNGFIEKLYNVIYVGTASSGIMGFDPNLGSLKSIGLNSENAKYGFMKKIDGRMFFGGPNGLKEIKYNQQTGYFSATDAVVTKTKKGSKFSLLHGFIIKGSDGNVYVGTKANGIYKLVGDKLVEYDKTSVEYGWAKEVNGNVYVGSVSGLFRMDRKGLTLIQKGNFQETFIEQIDGLVYVGIKGEGLRILEDKNKMDGKLIPISNFSPQGGFLRNTESGIYFGTKNNGLQKIDFSNIQPETVSALNTNLTTGRLVQGNLKLSEVVKKINNVDDVKKYLGVTLTKRLFSDIKSIKAEVAASGKAIKLTVELIIQGTPQPVVVEKTYAGIDDVNLSKIASQNTALENIKHWVTNKKITNSNGKKVSELASEMFKQPNIGKKVEFLKEISEIDLNAILKGSVTTIKNIELTADPATGDIVVKVETYTPDVPNKTQTITGLLKGDSDLTFQHKANIKKLNEMVKKLVIKEQKVNVSKIHDIETLKKETGIDLTNLPSSSQYLVKATKTKDGVSVEIQVITKGAIQTNEVTTLKIKRPIEAKKGLSSGAVAGIVIGVLIAIFGIGAGIIIKKKKNKANNENNDDFMNKIESLD